MYKQLSTESPRKNVAVLLYGFLIAVGVEFKKSLKERPTQFRTNRLTPCKSRGVSSLQCHEIPQLLWEIQPGYGREGMLRHDLLHTITG